MNQPQGAEAEIVEESTEGSNTEPETNVEEAQAEPEATETEVEEIVDYQARSEKLEKDVTGRQSKIDKQRAALAQSNQKIQELTARIAENAQVDAPVEPNIDNYETHDEYVDALADFRADIKVKTKQDEFLTNQKQKLEFDRMETEKAAFAKSENEHRVNNPQYDKSKDELQSHMELNPVNPVVGDAILDSAKAYGNVADVINYFGENGGENLAEFDRIALLSPPEAAVEIYKIQQKLKAAPTKKEKKPVGAPAKRPKGGGNPKKDLSSGDVLKNLGLK